MTISQSIKKSLNQSGSLSLSMIFTTSGAVGFILMMYNLSAYVGSVGVVNESARATARCLTPTDPACVEILSDNPAGIELDWYGRVFNDGDVADVSVRTFNYTASMQTDTYTSSFNTFKADAGTQDFSVNYEEVPLKTFEAFGEFEIPSGQKLAKYRVPGGTIYEPRYDPNFPSFEQNTTSGGSSWGGRTFSNSGSSNRSNVSAGGNNDFTTGYINVPEFSNNAKVKDCEETARLAGGSGDECIDYAFVAIKALSRVRATTGTTDVKWGDGGGIEGLRVEIRDKNNRHVQTRNLGGYDKKTINTNTVGYNLWLRGPRNSHGGAGSNHSGIRVPRGGKFRVRAFVKNLGPNPADINITVLTYVDSYTSRRQEPVIVDCEPEPYRGFTEQQEASCEYRTCTPINCNKDYCASKRAFRRAVNTGEITANLRSCETEKTNSEYTCTESELTIPGSSKAIYSNTQAVCTDAWRPSSLPSNTGNVCSWQTTNAGVAEVGSSESCPLAVSKTQTASCENPYVVNGTTPSTSNCSNLDALIRDIASPTNVLNLNQDEDAPKFGALPSTSFATELSNIREHSFWTNKDPQGGNLPADKKTDTHQITNSNNYFVRTNGSSQNPSNTDTLAQIQAAGLNIEHNWENFSENVNSLVNTQVGERKTFKINNVYPFNEEETEEIYYGQTDPSAGWDFQVDCNTDSNCESEGLDTFESTQAMLRSFAASQVPQASDESYAFTSSAELVGFKYVGEFPATNPPSAPSACYPYKVVCNGVRSVDDQEVYLGRTNQRPENCSLYGECIAKVPTDIDLEVPGTEEIIDTVLAKGAGMTEIKRLSPNAYLQEECSDDEVNCAEITINTSESGQKAIVEVSYNMPISFPLSAILDKESIKLNYTKEEVIERSFVGNSNL